MINRENLIKIGRAGGNTSNRETPDQIGRVGMSGFVCTINLLRSEGKLKKGVLFSNTQCNYYIVN